MFGIDSLAASTKVLVLAILVVLVASATGSHVPATHAAGPFSDGTFANADWDITIFKTVTASSASRTQVNSGETRVITNSSPMLWLVLRPCTQCTSIQAPPTIRERMVLSRRSTILSGHGPTPPNLILLEQSPGSPFAKIARFTPASSPVLSPTARGCPVPYSRRRLPLPGLPSALQV